MNKRILISLIAVFCLAFSIDLTMAGGKPKTTLLPKVPFKDTVSAETMKYLGLSRQKNFTLHDIRGSLLVIELFSTYCMTCPQNVPIINSLYTTVEKDAGLRGKVKVLGIAIGNTQSEVDAYKNKYNVLFPVLTDYDFAVHDAMGNPRVPHTIFVKGTTMRKTIVDSHQGVFDSSESLLKKLRSMH